MRPIRHPGNHPDLMLLARCGKCGEWEPVHPVSWPAVLTWAATSAPEDRFLCIPCAEKMAPDHPKVCQARALREHAKRSDRAGNN